MEKKNSFVLNISQININKSFFFCYLQYNFQFVTQQKLDAFGDFADDSVQV